MDLCVAFMLQEAKLIDSQFTLVDATLAFLWSRMFVIDEIKDYVRYPSSLGFATLSGNHTCLLHHAVFETLRKGLHNP